MKEFFLDTATIDSKNGFAYFGTAQYSNSKILKIRLSDFTVNGVLVSNSNLFSATLQPSMNYSYFGSDNSIMRINLQTFTLVDEIIIGGSKKVALLDLPASTAYFTTGATLHQLLLFGK